MKRQLSKIEKEIMEIFKNDDDIKEEEMEKRLQKRRKLMAQGRQKVSVLCDQLLTREERAYKAVRDAPDLPEHEGIHFKYSTETLQYERVESIDEPREQRPKYYARRAKPYKPRAGVRPAKEVEDTFVIEIPYQSE